MSSYLHIKSVPNCGSRIKAMFSSLEIKAGFFVSRWDHCIKTGLHQGAIVSRRDFLYLSQKHINSILNKSSYQRGTLISTGNLYHQGGISPSLSAPRRVFLYLSQKLKHTKSNISSGLLPTRDFNTHAKFLV